MSTESFGKARRVRRRDEYQRTFQAGIRVQGRYFTLVMAPSAGRSTRVGIVASKKLGDAVCRNRAKRLIREIFRKIPQREGGLGVDVVVIPRGSLFDASYELLENDFRGAFRRGVSRIQADAAR